MSLMSNHGDDPFGCPLPLSSSIFAFLDVRSLRFCCSTPSAQWNIATCIVCLVLYLFGSRSNYPVRACCDKYGTEGGLEEVISYFKGIKMEEVIRAVEDQMNQIADLLQHITAEFRSGLRPAYDNFIGFFHAIDWKEPWLRGLMSFHVILLLVILFSRKNTNFQMCLFLLALGGVYFAESFNAILSSNWKSFASQNYFDRQGIFLSALWSGPLLLNAVLILINTLISLCIQMVKWKKAELRHKARLASSKQE